jgi:hypothetical protein
VGHGHLVERLIGQNHILWIACVMFVRDNGERVYIQISDSQLMGGTNDP